MDNHEYEFPYIIDPKPDAERKRKRDMRKFWFMWVPLTFVVALFLGIISNNGALILPAWGILVLISAGLD